MYHCCIVDQSSGADLRSARQRDTADPEAFRDLAAVLHDSYGLIVDSADVLGGEVDQNWLVTTPDDRSFVAKIAPPGSDLAQLTWQATLLTELAGRSTALEFPRSVAALDATAVTTLPRSPDSRVRVGDTGTRQHEQRYLRVQTWLAGDTLTELDHHSPVLLQGWGRAAAQLLDALASVRPHERDLSHHWDVTRAPAAIAAGLPAVTDPLRVAQVHTILRWFGDVAAPRIADLRRQVVHQDLNDFNVLTRLDDEGLRHVTGVLDFGDALFAPRVSELAVAVAYAMLRKPDPLAAAADVVRGFAELVELDDAELAVVYPLAAARLCVNAVTWTSREPANGAYARARMHHTWPTIAQLTGLPPALAEMTLRDAAGRGRPEPAVFSLSAPQPVAGRVAVLEQHRADVGRSLLRRTSTGPVPTTVRLGCRLDVGAGTSVTTPLDGTLVETRAGVQILRHDTATGTVWARWTRLAGARSQGQDLSTGQPFGRSVDGVCEVALFTDLEAARCAPSSNLVTRSHAAAWASIAPDPRAYLGLIGTDSAVETDYAEGSGPDVRTLEAERAHHFASSQRHYYDRPMRLVASEDVWLIDDSGYRYLDVINNVAHVGHANRAVTAAMTGQAGRLNTNSRFLYDGIAQYAGRLASLLPDPLEVVFLVCSGSEANDLALRIARQVTARDHVVVVGGAYHGNTAAVTAVSPNRYRGPGGTGPPATTHEVTQPNRYRGPWGYDDPAAGVHYAADVTTTVQSLQSDATPPAAFIVESLLGTAGTIEHPPGYLATAFAAIRTAGGLCISDEVQVGFGRLGRAFWGFQTHGVVPDIVTMGKPIGNGYPMAAVVTTRAIADAFDTGMKYFNTFGGNPVACAVGTAVLDEIADRGLQANAGVVGRHLRDRLDDLARRHRIIGDVRGQGLYLGLEFVCDRATKVPAAQAARRIAERLKDEGVISYPTGDLDNVLKVKPPMTFTSEHADLFADVLDEVLTTGW